MSNEFLRLKEECMQAFINQEIAGRYSGGAFGLLFANRTQLQDRYDHYYEICRKLCIALDAADPNRLHASWDIEIQAKRYVNSLPEDEIQRRARKLLGI
jgi:uncharacterized protein with NRDE domain